MLTPPDVISQMSLAMPLMLLYEGSIWSVRMVEKKAKAEAAAKAAAAAAAEAGGQAGGVAALPSSPGARPSAGLAKLGMPRSGTPRRRMTG